MSQRIWTAKEEERLIEMMQGGENSTVIAKKLNRSPQSVNSKIQKMSRIGRITGRIRSQRVSVQMQESFGMIAKPSIPPSNMPKCPDGYTWACNDGRTWRMRKIIIKKRK